MSEALQHIRAAVSAIESLAPYGEGVAADGSIVYRTGSAHEFGRARDLTLSREHVTHPKAPPARVALLRVGAAVWLVARVSDAEAAGE